MKGSPAILSQDEEFYSFFLYTIIAFTISVCNTWEALQEPCGYLRTAAAVNCYSLYPFKSL